MPKLIVNRTVTETVTYEVTEEQAQAYEADGMAALDEFDPSPLWNEQDAQVEQEEINWTRVER